jgi:hypothetical protein
VDSIASHAHACFATHPSWFVFRVLCALGVSAVRFCSEVTIAKSTQTGKAGRSVPGSQFRVLRAYPNNPAARTAITSQAKRFQWFG